MLAGDEVAAPMIFRLSSIRTPWTGDSIQARVGISGRVARFSSLGYDVGAEGCRIRIAKSGELLTVEREVEYRRYGCRFSHSLFAPAPLTTCLQAMATFVPPMLRAEVVSSTDTTAGSRADRNAHFVLVSVPKSLSDADYVALAP